MSESRIDDGRAFHNLGAHISKARSPYGVLALGTINLELSLVLIEVFSRDKSAQILMAQGSKVAKFI